MPRRTTRPTLTPEQRAEAQRIRQALLEAATSDLDELAELLAVTDDEHAFGATEFAVRDIVLRVGAEAIETALAGRKKRGYDGSSRACIHCPEAAKFQQHRNKIRRNPSRRGRRPPRVLLLQALPGRPLPTRCRVGGDGGVPEPRRDRGRGAGRDALQFRRGCAKGAAQVGRVGRERVHRRADHRAGRSGRGGAVGERADVRGEQGVGVVEGRRGPDRGVRVGGRHRGGDAGAQRGGRRGPDGECGDGLECGGPGPGAVRVRVDRRSEGVGRVAAESGRAGRHGPGRALGGDLGWGRGNRVVVAGALPARGGGDFGLLARGGVPE